MDRASDRPGAAHPFRGRAVFASFALTGIAALLVAAWMLKTLILAVFLAIGHVPLAEHSMNM